MVLTDSNILVHSAQPRSPQYALTEAAMGRLRHRRETLCIAPQNVVEFWSVATRPISSSGMGFSALQASAEITTILRLFRLLAYTQDVLEKWRQIVLTHNVSGKKVHDAHLVAMMQAHSITSILTFNEADFKRYPGITVLSPAHLA